MTKRNEQTEPRIIYRQHVVSERGKGAKKRFSVTATFHDEARPDKARVYDFSAIENTIADRTREGKETKGLVYGRDRVLEEYTKRGMTPPETRKARRRRIAAFVSG